MAAGAMTESPRRNSVVIRSSYIHILGWGLRISVSYLQHQSECLLRPKKRRKPRRQLADDSPVGERLHRLNESGQ